MFKYMYFFYVLFTNECMGDKPTFRKIVVKISKNVWKHLYEVYLPRGSVNVHHYSPSLRWIIVLYLAENSSILNFKYYAPELWI